MSFFFLPKQILSDAAHFIIYHMVGKFILVMYGNKFELTPFNLTYGQGNGFWAIYHLNASSISTF